MCRHVHVTLSADERQQVKSHAGIMAPIYATVVLALVAIAAVGSLSRQGELIASSPASTATR